MAQSGKPRTVFPLRRIMQIAAAVILIAASAWLINSLLDKSSERIFSEEFAPYPAETNKLAPPPPPQDTFFQRQNEFEEKPLSTSPKQMERVDRESEKDEEAYDGEAQEDMTAAEELPPPIEDATAPVVTFSREEPVQAEYSQAAPSSGEPERADAVRSRAETDKKKEVKPSAAGVYDEARSAAPGSISASGLLFHEGMKFYSEKNYTSAVTSFRKSLEFEPEQDGASFYTGVSYMALNKPDSGLLFLDPVRPSSTYYEAALWYKALAYVNKDDQRQAKKTAEKIISLNGDYRARAEELLKDLK